MKKDVGHPVNGISNVIYKTFFCLERNVFSKFIKGVPLITPYERKVIKKKSKKTTKKYIYSKTKELHPKQSRG